VAADHLKACTGINWVSDTCDAQQAELAEKALSIDCNTYDRAISGGWLPGIRLHDEVDDFEFRDWLGGVDRRLSDEWGAHIDWDDLSPWFFEVILRLRG
jgi:hypothetical protein